MTEKKPLPPRRHTVSREYYWREMFNDFSGEETDYAISGWSPQGLGLRMKTYVQTLPSLNLAPGELVLDLGCGAGAYSRILAELGYRVIGVDYAAKVAIKARKKTTLQEVDFVSGDATCLPFADHLFGHVVCIGLFQALHKHREAMNEIFRVLKPEGLLCLMTLNRRYLKAVFDRKLEREEIIMVEGQPQPRLNTYDPKFFMDELAETGFVNLKSRPVQIYPTWINPLAPFVGLWNHVPGLRDLTARSFMISGTKPL